jgi:hypothetical protein
MAVEPAEQLIVTFRGVGKLFAAVTAIRSQHIDIQLSSGDIDTNKVKFLFHSETNLVNADYRENRSMILSGLSLVEKGQSTAGIYITGSWPKAGYGMWTA